MRVPAQAASGGKPGRETTAKTRMPHPPWLRRYWKVLTGAGAVVLILATVGIYRSASRRNEQSALLRGLKKEGTSLLSDGRYESLRKAEQVFRRLLQRSPSDIEAREARLFAVAALAIEFGEGLERAADLLDRLGEAKTDLGASGRCLAALAAGKLESAAKEAESASKQHPRSPWVAYAKAWVERYSDSPDTALVLLAGVDGGPARTLHLRSRISALLELDRHKETTPLFATLEEGQAKAPWAILLKLRARLADPRQEISLPDLDSVLTISTDSQNRSSALQRRVAHLLLAKAYFRLGKDSEQRQHTDKALDNPDLRDPVLGDLLAAHLVRLGDFKRAEAMAEEALRRFPRRRSLVYAQASALLAFGRPADALNSLGAVPVQHRNAHLLLVEANSLLALDRQDEARRILDRLRRDYSDLLPIRLAWARLLAREKRLDDALSELEELLKQEPRNVEAIQEAARIELAKGKAANAITRLEAAASFRPADAQLRADLVEACLAGRDFKKAASILSDALAAFPNDPSLLAARGRSLLLEGRLEDASGAFKKAIEQDPRRPAPAIGLAEILLTRAKLQEAEAAVSQVEKLSPGAGRFLRGWLLTSRWDLGLRDPEASAKLLRQVAKNPDPQGRTAAMLLIEIHAKLGNRRAAKDELKRQTKLHGDRPELLSAYGLALVGADANDDAISTLERALKGAKYLDVSKTILARTHARLSQAKWQAGDFPGAKRSADEALGLWPECGHALAMLGILEYERMQFRAARQQLRSAVEKDPTLALAHHYLGLAELQLGERAAGRKALARSLELRPKGQLADEARRAIKR